MALRKVDIIPSILMEKVPSLVVSSCETDWVGESRSCVKGEVGVGALVGDWGVDETDGESIVGECSAGLFLCCMLGEEILLRLVDGLIVSLPWMIGICGGAEVVVGLTIGG